MDQLRVVQSKPPGTYFLIALAHATTIVLELPNKHPLIQVAFDEKHSAVPVPLTSVLPPPPPPPSAANNNKLAYDDF
jgi:hypothetical protein